jgi:hypothetical protein
MDENECRGEKERRERLDGVLENEARGDVHGEKFLEEEFRGVGDHELDDALRGLAACRRGRGSVEVARVQVANRMEEWEGRRRIGERERRKRKESETYACTSHCSP